MAESGKKKSIFENVPLLVLLGLLAGAAGGLGVGMMQLRSLTTSASSSAAK
jgi:hypothetical protein